MQHSLKALGFRDSPTSNKGRGFSLVYLIFRYFAKLPLHEIQTIFLALLYTFLHIVWLLFIILILSVRKCHCPLSDMFELLLLLFYLYCDAHVLALLKNTCGFFVFDNSKRSHKQTRIRHHVMLS